MEGITHNSIDLADSRFPWQISLTTSGSQFRWIFATPSSPYGRQPSGSSSACVGCVLDQYQVPFCFILSCLFSISIQPLARIRSHPKTGFACWISTTSYHLHFDPGAALTPIACFVLFCDQKRFSLCLLVQLRRVARC